METAQVDVEPRVAVALLAARNAHTRFNGSPEPAIRRLIECRELTVGDLRKDRHHALLVRSLVSLCRLARRAAGEDTGPDQDWRLGFDLDRELVRLGVCESEFSPEAAESFERPDYDPLAIEYPHHAGAGPRLTYGLAANCCFAERELDRLRRRELGDAADRIAYGPVRSGVPGRLALSAVPHGRLSQSELDAAADEARSC
ncbi:MAG: hypothetical protein ACR2HD_04750 [Solirubrobacteraceae bacterium]|nr:MAG: hypothetical protein DLM63_10785 [Solirubrobacterales bacterium]